jgi:hypothetical protein
LVLGKGRRKSNWWPVMSHVEPRGGRCQLKLNCNDKIWDVLCMQAHETEPTMSDGHVGEDMGELGRAIL